MWVSRVAVRRKVITGVAPRMISSTAPGRYRSGSVRSRCHWPGRRAGDAALDEAPGSDKVVSVDDIRALAREMGATTTRSSARRSPSW